MTRTRRAIVAVAALAMPLASLSMTAPVAADVPSLGQVGTSTSDTDRVCVGVDDPDRSNTTWVCTPEAQWYAQVIALLMSLKPI